MSKISRIVAGLACAAMLSFAMVPSAANAQAGEMYIGEIFTTGANFCPIDSAELNGQLLAISENDALFALIGTIYGGDGQETFALPDMRGRVPIGQFQGPGLSNRVIGETLGQETITLTTSNMPAHSHSPQMRVARVNATLRSPIGAYMARSATNVYDPTAPVSSTLAADAIQSSIVGGNQPFNNLQPVTVNRFCIVLFGIFPSRP